MKISSNRRRIIENIPWVLPIVITGDSEFVTYLQFTLFNLISHKNHQRMNSDMFVRWNTVWSRSFSGHLLKSMFTYFSRPFCKIKSRLYQIQGYLNAYANNSFLSWLAVLLKTVKYMQLYWLANWRLLISTWSRR